MQNDIVSAVSLRAEFETQLLAALVDLLGASTIATPWAAVSIAYHHGLSFDCVIGVLPDVEWVGLQNSEDAMDLLNPAEWEHYDEEGLFIENKRVTELEHQLTSLVGSDLANVPRYGRAIFTRIASCLRSKLVVDDKLQEDGLVYATEYSQCDLRENAAESNPMSALQRFGLG